MSQYNLSLNTTFQPFTYEEMLKPVLIATQEHRAIEEGLATLEEEAAIWDKLANSAVDKDTYDVYKNFSDEVEAMITSMNMYAGGAWDKLHGFMTSTLKVDYVAECEKSLSKHLGRGVKSIEANAFSNCPWLSEVYCRATTPPVLGEGVFSNSEELGNIYVPAASVDAYKKAAGWSKFADKIMGYDFIAGSNVMQSDLFSVATLCIGLLSQGSIDVECGHNTKRN